MTYDLIAWCSDPKITAAQLLHRARDLTWIANGDRGPSFTPPFPTGLLPGSYPDLLGWLNDREKWRADKIGSPVMDGLNLPRLPGSPHPEALIAELVSFAMASLNHIDHLATTLRERDRTVAAERKRHDVQTDAFNTEISERDDREAAFRRDLHDEREAHAATRRAAATEADALAHDLAEARETARIAASERDLARQQADAWRASSDASAQALAILRAALRIPGGADGAMVRR